MQKSSRWKWSFGLAAAACAAVLAGPGSARGQSSAIGELGAGGTAQGDISNTAGEEDRIGIDLGQGSALTATLTATFTSEIDLLGPNDAATSASFGAAATKSLVAWQVPESGRYHFRIRSADGSQGTYKLTAQAAWPSRLALDGQAGGALQVALPAGASVKGTISATPAGSWDPAVSSFMAPNGVNLLASALQGAKGIVRLPKTTTSAAGMHAIAVGGPVAGATFVATLTVKPPKTKPAKIDIRNGLAGVSFAQDGVAQMLVNDNCTKCHAWASTYAGAKQYARLALPRIQSGQMPAGGPRVSAADLSLFKQWVATGMQP
jgi:hypothetical protein